MIKKNFKDSNGLLGLNWAIVERETNAIVLEIHERTIQLKGF